MRTLSARLDMAERRAPAKRLPPMSAFTIAKAAGLDPDPWQQTLLESTADRILLNCSRQAGKSSTVAVLALHEALYVPGAPVLLLARSERQSKELFRKCLDTYDNLGRPVNADAESTMTLELSNRSRIIALPGNEANIRSFSGVRLIAIDEASRVPDELYKSLRPMLAVSRGRLVGLTSPWGKRGWFYEAWKSAERWERYEVPATMVPRITPEFLAEELIALGEVMFRQEYMCSFEDTEDSVFSSAFIERLHDAAIAPLFPFGVAS